MTNVYDRFQSLVGKASTDVVTITAVTGDGTSKATTLSGSAVTIKGDSVTVGNKAFIRNNEIVRQAPDHTINEVSI